jgi:hypothetical protein
MSHFGNRQWNRKREKLIFTIFHIHIWLVLEEIGPGQVTAICVIIIALLILVYSLVDAWIFPLKLKYSLKFPDNQTYASGDLSMVVSNNGLESSKKLFIHGVKDQSVLFSSPLSTQLGKTISYLVIGNGQHKIPLKVSNENVTEIDVRVENLSSGTYNGWLYLTNGSSFTIPIVVSTEPKFVQAVILVVTGVLISIIFWELFFLLDKKKKVSDKMNRVNNIVDNFDGLLNIYTDDQKIAFAEYEDPGVQRLTRQIKKIDNRYAEKGVQIVSFQLATVIFGIVTGVVGALSNSYVTNSIEITPPIASILIGLGLGIGSLKGLVDKPDKGNNSE